MRNLEFKPGAFDDLTYWVRKDRKKAMRILQLLDSVRRTPFHGIGKPEPLKHNLAKHWSRRIDEKHRVVYQIKKDKIVVVSCRFHYPK